jgi:hypothetical protein
MGVVKKMANIVKDLIDSPYHDFIYQGRRVLHFSSNDIFIESENVNNPLFEYHNINIVDLAIFNGYWLKNKEWSRTGSELTKQHIIDSGLYSVIIEDIENYFNELELTECLDLKKWYKGVYGVCSFNVDITWNEQIIFSDILITKSYNKDVIYDFINDENIENNSDWDLLGVVHKEENAVKHPLFSITNYRIIKDYNLAETKIFNMPFFNMFINDVFITERIYQSEKGKEKWDELKETLRNSTLFDFIETRYDFLSESLDSFIENVGDVLEDVLNEYSNKVANVVINITEFFKRIF